MGHICPRGLKCSFLKQGKCKYTKRESVHLSSHHNEGSFFLTWERYIIAEMHTATPDFQGSYHGRYRAHKQSVDGISEMALSEISQ